VAAVFPVGRRSSSVLANFERPDASKQLRPYRRYGVQGLGTQNL